MENIMKYITNLQVPIFLFKIIDLEEINCPKSKFSSILKALKIKWAQSNFELSFDQLLNEAKNLLK